MNKILVTDSLFINAENVRTMEAAGYEVERLDKPAASEEELCAAIKGKVGYILGGVEYVTPQVIEAAGDLKAIVFTGIDIKPHIPSWKLATQKGIAIVNTPDALTSAVAEWAITAALSMNRHFFELGRLGESKFITSPGLQGQRIGIIGLGRIGGRIAKMLEVFDAASIAYYSPHRKTNLESKEGLEYGLLDDVLATSDVIFLCVDSSAGQSYFDAEKLAKMKTGALLVSFMAPGVIDTNALYDELKTRRLRAVSDHPAEKRFTDLPLGTWYSFNDSNAFNTVSSIKLISETAVASLLNVLKTGDDKNLVNSDYRKQS